MSEKEYRNLNEGEIILATDEIYHDHKKEWVAPHPNSIGTKAPSPLYTSHRLYRRKVTEEGSASIFAVEVEFSLYCQRVRLDTDNCSPTQVIETRRAFYAGVSQMLAFLKSDGFCELSEDAGVAELQRIYDQCSMFWQRQAGLS